MSILQSRDPAEYLLSKGSNVARVQCPGSCSERTPWFVHGRRAGRGCSGRRLERTREAIPAYLSSEEAELRTKEAHPKVLRGMGRRGYCIRYGKIIRECTLSALPCATC